MNVSTDGKGALNTVTATGYVVNHERYTNNRCSNFGTPMTVQWCDVQAFIRNIRDRRYVCFCVLIGGEDKSTGRHPALVLPALEEMVSRNFPIEDSREPAEGSEEATAFALLLRSLLNVFVRCACAVVWCPRRRGAFVLCHELDALDFNCIFAVRLYFVWCLLVGYV